MVAPDPNLTFLEIRRQARGNPDVRSQFYPEQVDLQLLVMICFLQGVVIAHNRGLKAQLVVWATIVELRVARSTRDGALTRVEGNMARLPLV